MLTYQVRPRKFLFIGSRVPTFPAECVARFHFLPLQAFGDSPEGGRTAVRGAEAEILFNAHTGEHTIKSSRPFSPVHVDLTVPSGRAHWRGSVFTLEHRFASTKDFQNVIMSIYHHLPSILTAVLADPPVVEKVEGEVDGVPFSWQLMAWRITLRPRTETEQAAVIGTAFDRLQLAATPQRGRLLAALHYFHMARRLAQQGSSPGEFMAEGLLNLAKLLEVLFPPSTRDAIREGLRGLGYSEGESEAQFLPAVALRNEVDVGHVSLAKLSERDRRVIHAYTDAAEGWFGELLNRLIERIERGEADVAPHEHEEPKKEVRGIIERLRRNLPKDLLGEEQQ
jgi:hypothetical protein